MDQASAAPPPSSPPVPAEGAPAVWKGKEEAGRKPSAAGGASGPEQGLAPWLQRGQAPAATTSVLVTGHASDSPLTADSGQQQSGLLPPPVMLGVRSAAEDLEALALVGRPTGDGAAARLAAAEEVEGGTAGTGNDG